MCTYRMIPGFGPLQAVYMRKTLIVKQVKKQEPVQLHGKEKPTFLLVQRHSYLTHVRAVASRPEESLHLRTGSFMF